MIRILSIDSPTVDGVTWWRNLRPLTELQRKWPDIQVRFLSEKASIYELLQADVVIMYRPITAESLGFIKTCKSIGLKIILDIDDNLWRLPAGHPNEADYNDHAQVLHQIYALADGIWCSTEPLLYFTDAMDGRGVVVPNAVLEKDLPKEPSPYRGVVCWRGSSAQQADIESKQAIRTFKDNEKSFPHWIFWGYHPAAMRTPRTSLKRRVDPISYIFGLRHTGINLMWKPLAKNEFNDCKSNIAWIEATMAGAVCVTNYAGTGEWMWAIDHFTQNDDFIASQWRASREAILKHYNLDRINAIRYHHILQVLGMEGETVNL